MPRPNAQSRALSAAMAIALLSGCGSGSGWYSRYSTGERGYWHADHRGYSRSTAWAYSPDGDETWIALAIFGGIAIATVAYELAADCASDCYHYCESWFE